MLFCREVGIKMQVCIKEDTAFADKLPNPVVWEQAHFFEGRRHNCYIQWNYILKLELLN